MPSTLSIFLTIAGAISAPEVKLATSEKDWQVQIELTVFIVPEKLALEVLEEPLDETGAAAAYKKVRAAFDKGDATLTGTETVRTEHGVQQTAHSGQLLRYPIAFELPTFPDFDKAKDIRALPKDLKVLEFPAITFETQSLGVKLTANPEISKSGEWVRITAQVQHVRFIQWDEIEAGVTPSGTRIVGKQPRFSSLTTEGSYYLRKDARTLAGAHKLPGTKEGEMELFFLRAATVRKPATPIPAAPVPPLPPGTLTPIPPPAIPCAPFAP